MDFPIMLYLKDVSNFIVANDQDEYDQLTEHGYTTHDKVNHEPEPEPKEMDSASEISLLNGVIDELEDEIELLRQKLAVYESAKDTNEDGVISYDEMTANELQQVLKQRGVEFKTRDSKDTLIQLAKDSE